MIEVSLNRLLELCDLDAQSFSVEWPGCRESITIQDVISAKAHGFSEETIPYGDTFTFQPIIKSKDYHIQRILYFINHHEEIQSIQVENPCILGAILPGCMIVDGWHRLFAAVVLEIDKVSIYYGGRCDVEDYLTGVSDTPPNDLI